MRQPRRKVLLRRKRRCPSPHFGQDLLRRIHSQSGDLRQPVHGIHMLAEQTRALVVYLADLLFEELQLLQRHLQQSTVDGIELCAGAQSVA